MDENKTRVLVVRVTPAEQEALEEWAREDDRTVSQVVRLALREYLASRTEAAT